MVWPAIIGAGSALLAGSMGNRSARRAAREQRDQDLYLQNRNFREQRNQNTHGLRRRVNDARAAGLHPLAALGAQITPFTPVHGGGGSVYTGDSMADAVRQAGSIAADSLQQDPESESRTRLNNAQSAVLEAQAANRISPGAAPYPGAQDEIHEVVPPQRTGALSVGRPYLTNPHFSDAQTYEDRYGELGGSLLGLFNFPADLYQFIKDLVGEGDGMFDRMRGKRTNFYRQQTQE